MQRRQERVKKMEEKKVYLQLYEAMEALVKINLETNKIMDFIKFDVGNVVMVTGGRAALRPSTCCLELFAMSSFLLFVIQENIE
jgi:ribosomal protein S4E